MKNRFLFWTLAALCVFALTADADAQSRRKSSSRRKTTTRSAKPVTPKSTVETGLCGVKLFDSAMKLLDIYGNPNEMLNLGGSGGAAAGPAAGRSGGGAAGGGARGGAAGGGQRGGGGLKNPGENEATRPADSGGIIDADWNFDFTPGTETIEAFGGGGGGGGQARGGRLGAGGQGGAGRGRAGGGAARGGGGGQYMRWIYKQPLARYTFIIDKSFRIVQIEAVLGADDPKVRSIKGVKFGTDFATVLKTYGTPDAFDVGGDTIMMRYLANHHVAFRLNRLAPGKPHQVTAMVVSGGKA